MNLSEIRQILSAEGIRLTKSLGQNFLHDANQLRRILDLAALRPGDRVLEIGPGLGALTGLLVAQPVEVTAIEKDHRLYEFLLERYASAGNLTLIHADALDRLRSDQPDYSGWKVVSNLPYSVASPILVELAQANGRPETIVVTLQLEVAQRIMAGPGSKDYGVLTLLILMDYEPGAWFKIPSSCFFPEPDIASACLELRRRPVPLVTAEERSSLAGLIKLGFSQRRKMLVNLLKQKWPREQLLRAFAETGIPDQARAESLPLERFIALNRRLLNKS